MDRHEREVHMSYLIVAPESIFATASSVSGIGSTITSANAAAAPATLEVLAAGADEVSAGIAALFSAHARAYQTLSAHAAMFHDQFVRALTTGGAAYAGAEAATVQQNLLDVINAPTLTLLGRPLIGNGTAGAPGTGANGQDGGILVGNGAPAAPGPSASGAVTAGPPGCCSATAATAATVAARQPSSPVTAEPAEPAGCSGPAGPAAPVGSVSTEVPAAPAERPASSAPPGPAVPVGSEWSAPRPTAAPAAPAAPADCSVPVVPAAPVERRWPRRAGPEAPAVPAGCSAPVALAVPAVPATTPAGSGAPAVPVG
ncbi:PE family protein [Mycobacterium kansasii 732]|nr:PE family protein [Mycobacterium kansasii 732]